MASSRRAVVLMAILLTLVGVYLFKHGPFVSYAQALFPPSAPPRLPGEPSVSAAQVQQLPDGHWQLEFDYYYPGQLSGVLHIHQAVAGDGAAAPHPVPPTVAVANRGRHHMKLEVPRPGGGVSRTTEIQVVMTDYVPGEPAQKPIATQKLPVTIEWPSFYMMQMNEIIASGKPEQVVEMQARRINPRTGRN